MAGTSIEWATHVWNPFTGCDIVSSGCKHCYAKTLAKRLKAMGNPRYQNDGEEPTSGPGFKFTVHWDKLDKPERFPAGARVFVNSMSDVFHPEAPTEAIQLIWKAAAHQPDVDFLILTKRPERMRAHLVSQDFKGQMPLPNVWLGVSIENRGTRDRVDLLRETPAALRFVSAEPLLMGLHGIPNRRRGFRSSYWAVPPLYLDRVDWLIVGGESGPGARPMDPDWARWLLVQCRKQGVAYFMKQMGGRYPGGELEDFPEDLRVRELPSRREPEALAA
jgi:protein gp37